jgi:hypothetical protein
VSIGLAVDSSSRAKEEENKGRPAFSSVGLPDGVVDGVGEEADGAGGGGEVEVGGERGERAVRARVVVEHRRDLPLGAGAGHEIIAIGYLSGPRACRTARRVALKTQSLRVLGCAAAGGHGWARR